MDRLCGFSETPQLTELDNTRLEQKVTLAEVLVVITAMQRGKSPSIDGIANDFYQDYKGEVAPLLVSL